MKLPWQSEKPESTEEKPADTKPAEGQRPLRWGILGAARIAGKSLIPAFRAAGADVAALAASNSERAEAMAREFGIPTAYEGYQRLLDDPNIDAVYLPLANGLHHEWVIKTALAGKHCLCEKPMALTAADAREMSGVFKSAGLVLQEAFMWRHHAQAAWLKQQLAAEAWGEIRQINALFAFTLDRENDYRWKPNQGGGAFWDIGCYCVNAARFLFGAEPVHASARAQVRPNPQPVDESMVGWLDFGDNRLAGFSCSFVAPYQQGIEIVGTEARITVRKPWQQWGRPATVIIEHAGKKTLQTFEPMNAYASMIESFTQRVAGGERGPGEDGLAQAMAMEKVRSSL